MQKLKKLLVGAVAVASLPLGLAGPATAAVPGPDSFAAPTTPPNPYTDHGCTVTAETPSHAGFTSTGRRIVRFGGTLACSGGRTVRLAHAGYENDTWTAAEDGADDVLFSTAHGPYTVPASGGTSSWSRYMVVEHSLRDSTADPYVELFQYVKFQVTSGGDTYPWTPSFRSSTRQFTV